MKNSSKKIDLQFLQFMLKVIENHLRFFAEQHPCDKISSISMQILRDDFDPTYFWCNECDGLVCREKDCCLNQVPEKPF